MGTASPLGTAIAIVRGRTCATKSTNAMAPQANKVSPGTLIQRSVCIHGVVRNSALRAYQYPFSTAAQVWNNPTGSKLPTHIANKPMFIDQKENFKSPS